ncbi:MAG: hypothetical protein EXS35_17265 [Pedosphaera sp.]|nr:hypothetical protein [Pedosphaera sp.]
MNNNRQIGSIAGGLFPKTLLLAFVLSLCTTVRGAIRTVTSTADILAAGTLRFEINSAAANDTINFDAALAGQTITLNLGELQITRNLVIGGPGPTNLAIVNNNGRVFHVLGGPLNAVISGLQLTGHLKGNNGGDGTLGSVNGGDGESVTGGCIQNEEHCELTVLNCFFTACQAIGGYGGNGYTNVLYGFVSHGGLGGSACGGAIFNNGGDLLLYHSTFANNFSDGGKGGNGYYGGRGGNGGDGMGGAVCLGYGNHNMLVVNCTFHANTASGGFGGNAGDAWINQIGAANGGDGGQGGNAQGGAVHFGFESACPAPDCTGVVHCTINKNEIRPGTGKPGGVGINGGLTGAGGLNGRAEGGGIYHYPDPRHVPVQNTIVAGNFATFTFTLGNIDYRGPDVFGSVASAGYNFIGIKDAYSSGWSAVLDFTGSTLLPLDPLLGPLQNNGGETLTLAPLSCSPVIDKGSVGGFNLDQILQIRPVGITAAPYLADGSDIGALELQTFPTTAPALVITLSVNQVIIRWPVAFNCFVLQENPGLLATNWVNSANAVTIVGNQCQVIVSPPTGNRFYRLFHQ